MIAVTAARLYTPLECIEAPLLLIEDGKVTELASRAARQTPAGAHDFGDAILSPGLLDIHIHGGAGHDVMSADRAGLVAVEKLLAAHGVTSYFPTTVTAPLDQTLGALDRLATEIERFEREPRQHEGRAQPLGIHLEGPFISHVRRGVHPPENLLPPTLAMFDRFWQAARGRIRMMTIAPELDGAQEVIAEAANRKICVSVGHSDAGMEATSAAVAAGARHATHTFNAMRPLDHRKPGIIGEVLTDPRLSADMIVDGIHVDPAIVRLFLAAKGPDSAVLISDATAATGMPEGRYRLGSLEVEVKDGRVTSGETLAGSVLTLDRALRNVMEFAHWDLQSALRLASINPARVVGLPERGKIEVGGRADIVVLSPAGEVKATIVGGVLHEA
jgi:N-acetylglucosamine-6-phosphate deacetylase